MLKINCPTCQTKFTLDSKSTFKPFCSERCKLTDLGEWASETRVIKGQTQKQAIMGQVDEFDIEEELQRLSKNGDGFFID